MLLRQTTLGMILDSQTILLGIALLSQTILQMDLNPHQMVEVLKEQDLQEVMEVMEVTEVMEKIIGSTFHNHMGGGLLEEIQITEEMLMYKHKYIWSKLLKYV